MINKRKILTFCTIIVLLLVFLSLFVKNPSKSTKGKNNISLTTMSMNKSGCISLEENEFFKKYTINCSNEINTLNYENKDKELIITLNKTDISNININSSGKVNFSEIKAKINQSEYILSFKKLFKSENYIHTDKLNKKNIIVFISKKQKPYKYKVEIDPGHGGNDPGTMRGNLYEKDLTLKISLFMEDNFRFNGCETIYTRKTDETVNINNIPPFTKNTNPDVFVSVHINSNKDKSCNGIATYYFNAPGSQLNENINLAKAVQNEVIKNDNWKDLGIKKNNYRVISHNIMPSILVECGFISNDKDKDNLSKDEVLKNLGKNISNGIINYLSQKH